MNRFYKFSLSVILAVLVALTLAGCSPKNVFELVDAPQDYTPKVDTTVKLGELFDSEEKQVFLNHFTARVAGIPNTDKDKSLQVTDKHVETPAYGVSRILDIIDSGVKMDYDYWSDAEIIESPDKAMTKLFYFPGKENAPFVFLCSGGAYTAVCNLTEGFSVAARLNALGLNAFGCTYRVASPITGMPDFDEASETALEDVAQALKFIFENKDTFKINTEKYAVAGFSAGGDLISKWCTEELGWKKYNIQKPSCMFLGYFYLEDVSLITDSYPETYFAYATNDPIADANKLQDMKTALNKHNIRYAEKIGETAGHGFGLGAGTDMQGWVDEAAKFWINR